MKKEVIEGIEHIKKSIQVCADIGLILDDGILGSKVYDKEDVMNAILLFFHVSGNYVLGEMMKQGCSFDFCNSKATEFGNAMHELILEYVKIDTKKYYK